MSHAVCTYNKYFKRIDMWAYQFVRFSCFTWGSTLTNVPSGTLLTNYVHCDKFGFYIIIPSAAIIKIVKRKNS